MEKSYLINGIQQVGIGNRKVYDTYDWYKENLGMRVQVFDEAAEANLMLPYTGGQPRSRHAILALNLNGGGGVEIWQYVDREAVKPSFEIQVGDLGILAIQYKCQDIESAHKQFSRDESTTPIMKNSAGQRHFYSKDKDGNWIDIIHFDSWFSKKYGNYGGVTGAVIGVSDMEKSIAFYQDILGYDLVLYRGNEGNDDLQHLQLNKDQKTEKYDRAILTHSDTKKGAFSRLFGKTQIELVKRQNYQGRKIFQDRLWGDMGYIHLCFDVNYMKNLADYCASQGRAFQVDSGPFGMGEAGGHFAYIEDPDGTLIEFVETHKVPIVKKLNWYLNLQKRKSVKPLPDWMIRAMGW